MRLAKLVFFTFLQSIYTVIVNNGDDAILNDTLPQDSKEIYKKSWEEFKVYVGEKERPLS